METNPRSPARVRLLDKLPKQGVGAEIGVWRGDFSAELLRVTQPKALHLIDPWLFQPEFSERMYGGSVAKSQADMDDIYNGVQERFSLASEVVLDRGKSAEIIPQFADGYLDWVYIDGNHYYDYVLQDLELSLSKVKAQGVISGDDYRWGKQYGFPVEKAVQHFVAKHKLEAHLEILENQYLITLAN